MGAALGRTRDGRPSSPASSGDDGCAAVRLVLSTMVPTTGGLCPVLDWHLAGRGGMSRARLAVAVGRALGLPEEVSIRLAAVAQAVHEASLLIDDINDRSETRRDRPAAWVRFGTDLAMLAGIRLLNSAHRLAVDLAAEGRVPVAVAASVGGLVEEALDGQATELSGVSGFWADYDWVVARKTGALMVLPVALPARAAELDEADVQRLTTVAERIGMAYQIADDIDDGGFEGRAWARVAPSPAERLADLSVAIGQDLDRPGDPVAAVLRSFVKGLFS